MAYAAFIILGLIVGSFLNVVINRLKSGEAFWFGRSHCPFCKRDLGPETMIPILSYVWLRGRCKYCGEQISIQYPLVEALTAAIFLLFALKFENISAQLIFLWILASFLIVIAVYDYKHFLILDKVVFTGAAVALLYSISRDLTNSCLFGWECATISGLLGAAFVSGFFWLQYFLSKGRWIGFGDVKFGLLLGLVVGFPLAIFMLFVAYMSGALVGVGLIAYGKKELGSKMPLGTFLAFAALVTLLYGEPLFNLYLGLIGI